MKRGFKLIFFFGRSEQCRLATCQIWRSNSKLVKVTNFLNLTGVIVTAGKGQEISAGTCDNIPSEIAAYIRGGRAAEVKAAQAKLMGT